MSIKDEFNERFLGKEVPVIKGTFTRRGTTKSYPTVDLDYNSPEIQELKKYLETHYRDYRILGPQDLETCDWMPSRANVRIVEDEKSGKYQISELRFG